MRTFVAQTLSPSEFEIVVVENGPALGAATVVHRVGRENPQCAIRFIYDPTPGLLTGRHRGGLEARGDILVFADDDIDASPRWLDAITGSFLDSDVHLVGGPSLPRLEIQQPGWVDGYWYTPPYGGRACIYLSLLDLGDVRRAIDANYVWGLNFAIRRATLFDLGGFHPDNIPDHLQHFQGDGETGLTMKINAAGMLTVYEPQALVHHRIPSTRLSVAYFRRRAFYQGVCDSFTAIRREPQRLLDEPSPVSQDQSLVASKSSESTAPARKLTFEEVNRDVQQAYRSGYQFHYDAVRRHPRLLEWVLRKDYWDYRLPDLGPDVMIHRPIG